MVSKYAPRPELDEAIRAGWIAGDSAAIIGRSMGVSKNTIIGRARRMKMPPRLHVMAVRPPPYQRKIRVMSVAEPSRPPTQFCRSSALLNWVAVTPPVADPGRGCLFPMWSDTMRTPRNALYCGAERNVPGRSYCAGHCGISYTAYVSRTDTLTHSET